MNKSILYKAKEDKDIQKDLRKLKALQKEPCDDAVSRQAVNDLYDRYHPRLATHVYEFGEELKALPSVTPKREQGKWIGVNPMVDTLMCSKCGENIISEEFKSNYCPNCGAEMR